MGYELYREVKVWAPASLTHREKLTAMVLADDANDKTRLTWNSVVDPQIMQQAMVKNDRDMRKVLARLQAEKVIENAGGGHNGRIAKFRFLHLDPDGCPGEPRCGCPLALAVQNEPATDDQGDDVGGPNSTGYETDHVTGPVQKEPATDGVGGPNRHRSRSKKDRPTPSSSSTPPPLSVADQVVRESGVVAEEERETFIRWIKNTYKPKGPAWWRRVAANGDFAALAEEWRAQRSPKLSALTPWCGNCGDNPAAEFNPNFRLVGGALCPDCHPDAPRSKAS